MGSLRLITERAELGLPTVARSTGRRAKVGGSAWESNPASPRERGATDFEDREGRRAPFTSVGSECNCGPLLSKNRLHDRPGISQILKHDIRSCGAQLVDAVIAGGDRDQSRAAGLRAGDVERRVANDDGV